MAVKIFVIYYSSYGHVAQLAKKIKEGIDSVDGAEGILYQVKETLPPEVTAKMHIPPQPSDIPFADTHNLTEADGFIFGFPTRYGGVPAQFKAFWDATGGLWTSGKLNGKPFGLFTSNGTLGGGQEVTLLSSLSNFIHHGMIYVPLGYSFGPPLFSLDEVRGGTPWGAGTYAGADGSRQPSKLELDIAEHQGKYTAGVIKKLAA